MANKLFSVVLILAMVLMASQVAALSPQQLAPLTNLPAHVKLSKQESVPSSDTICGGMWAKSGGTVCNRTSLLEFQVREQSRVRESLNHLTQSFMFGLKKYAQGVLMIDGVLSYPEMAKERQWLMLLANQNNFNLTVQEANKCWNYMIKVRSAALCSACSSSNFNYFIGSKALVKSQDYAEMSANCRNHLIQTMIYIEHGFAVIKAHMLINIQQFLSRNSDPRILNEIQAKKLQLLDQLTAIRADLKRVGDFIRDDIDTNSNKVYAAFFKLTMEPAILIVSNISNHAITSSSSIRTQLTNLNNWIISSGGRLLPLAPGPQQAPRELQLLSSSLNSLFSSDNLLATTLSNTTVVAQDLFNNQTITQANTNGQMATANLQVNFP